MADVRDLLVRFKGNTKGLDSAVTRAKKSVNGFQSTANKAGRGISNIFSGLSRTLPPLIVTGKQDP